MGNKTSEKTNPVLLIGFIVALIFLAIGAFTPVAAPGASLTERYEVGLLKVIMSVLGMVGGLTVIIIASIQNRKQFACPSCGAKIQSRDDRFCRVCGASLAK